LLRDGRTLFFNSKCPGGYGGWDIWQIRRVPKAANTVSPGSVPGSSLTNVRSVTSVPAAQTADVKVSTAATSMLVQAVSPRPADPNDWCLKNWDGEIRLSRGNYCGPQKKMDIHLEKDCRVAVSAGTFIKQARFRCESGSRWTVTGSLFREVDLGGDYALNFEATDSLFDECNFHKGGNLIISLWSTRWIFQNCVFSKHFFPENASVVDYSIRAIECTFHNLTLSKMRYKDDPAKQVQSRDLRFERCRFVNCEVPESFLATTVECVFDNCWFTTRRREDWQQAARAIVVNAFVVSTRTTMPQSYANGQLQVNFVAAAPTQRAGATVPSAYKAGRLSSPSIADTGPVSALGDTLPGKEKTTHRPGQ